MAELKPETKIKRRITKLNKIFKDVPEDKREVVKPLITRAAYMEYGLEKLEREMLVVGFVEEYQNGNNQFGKKQSSESKAYSTMIRDYNAVIKTLLSCLPEDVQPQAEDALDEFLRKRR